jgi:hypothetical protein
MTNEAAERLGGYLNGRDWVNAPVLSGWPSASGSRGDCYYCGHSVLLSDDCYLLNADANGIVTAIAHADWLICYQDAIDAEIVYSVEAMD